MGNLRKIPKNTRVLDEDGPPCPRCGIFTEIREHIKIREKESKRLFYYSKWYNCVNSNCKTNLIMPDEFRIYKSKRSENSFKGLGSSFFKKHKNKYEKEQMDSSDQNSRLEAIKQQLKPPWE